MPKTRIYIAGPYTEGDVAGNVRNAIMAAEELANAGFAPFVPHFTHFWHMMFPHPHEFWMQLDFQFVDCCQAVLRLPGPSLGADREVELAKNQGIPVFHDVWSLKAHFQS